MVDAFAFLNPSRGYAPPRTWEWCVARLGKMGYMLDFKEQQWKRQPDVLEPLAA